MSLALTIRTAADLAQTARAVSRAALNAAVCARIDAVARDQGYDSAAQLASYAVSTVPHWAAEAQAFVAWRDAVWLMVFDRQSALAPDDPSPPPAEVLAALPPCKP